MKRVWKSQFTIIIKQEPGVEHQCVVQDGPVNVVSLLIAVKMMELFQDVSKIHSFFSNSSCLPKHIWNFRQCRNARLQPHHQLHQEHLH